MSFIGSRGRLCRAAIAGICALLLASVPAGAANAAWAFRIAGTGDDDGNAIGVDAAGNTYVGGDFSGTVDFDPRSTTDLIASQGDEDGFVASYTPDDHLRWAFGIGGTSYDIVSALVVSGASVTIVGSFSNTVDLDPGPARHRVTAHGGYTDGFVVRVRQSDGGFTWGGRVGGTGFDELRSVAVDSSGNTLLAGHFTGTADLDPSSGVHNHQAMGSIDTFVTRIGPDGSFGWAVAFDGASEQEAYSVAAGPSNEVLFAGSFAGSLDLDPGSGAHVVASKGDYDAFVVTLTASGGFVRGATFGSTGIDFPAAVAADAGGNVWLAGTFAKTVDFDPGPATHTRTSKGSYDVFLVELGAAGAYVRLDTFGGTAQEEPTGMAIDGAGNVYLAGQFTSKTDFDPSSDRFFLTPVGDGDVFNLELSSSGTFRDAWSMGGAGNEGAYAIAALGQSVYTTGWFYANGDYDPGPGTRTLHHVNNSSDAFVVRVTH